MLVIWAKPSDGISSSPSSAPAGPFLTIWVVGSTLVPSTSVLLYDITLSPAWGWAFGASSGQSAGLSTLFPSDFS